MRKWMRTALALLATVSIGLTGCGGGSTGGGESAGGGIKKADGGLKALVYAVPADVKTMNRMLEGTKDGHIILNPLYDPLFVIDKNETRYYLAESHKVSDDGKKLTVTLRPDIKWHDGEKITADDLVFSMDAANDPDSGVLMSALTSIGGEPVKYKKVDDRTVEFNLPKPSSYFVESIGNLCIQPKHAFNGNTKMKDDPATQKGIGSGPHKLKEWKKGEAIIYEAFDGYYRGRAPLDQIIFRIIPDASAQDIALQNGEINMKEIANDQELEKYKKNPAFDIVSIPEGRVNYVYFNHRTGLFDDINTRKAVALALNVEEIVKGSYGNQGLGTVATTLLADKTFYRGSGIENYKQNIDEAKKLVKETGLDQKTIKMAYNSSRNFQKEGALIIQQELQAVGLKVEVTPLETMAFFSTGFSDYDLIMNGYPASGDPGQARQYGDFNRKGDVKNLYQSKEQLDLWAQGDEEQDVKKKEEIYHKLQEQAKEDYTLIPLAYTTMKFAVTKGYTGFEELQTIPVFEDYMRIKTVD